MVSTDSREGGGGGRPRAIGAGHSAMSAKTGDQAGFEIWGQGGDGPGPSSPGGGVDPRGKQIERFQKSPVFEPKMNV